MANPFAKMQEYFTAPHRVTHDWSYQNNLTIKMGKLYPFIYVPLTPGESLRIDSTFGLNFQPFVFPVQTRMRAHLHFFYVRYKDLYKDWLDKFGMTKEGLEMPYMKLTEENRDMVNTCELGDYLNIPTVTYGEFGNAVTKFLPRTYYDWNTQTRDSNYVGFLENIPQLNVSVFSSTFIRKVDKLGSFPTDKPRYAFIVSKRDYPEIDFSKGWNLLFAPAQEKNYLPFSYEVNIWPLDSSGTWTEYPSFTYTGDWLTENDSYDVLLNDSSFVNAEYLLVSFHAKDVDIPRPYDYPMIFELHGNTVVTYGLENKDVELSDLPFCSTENEDGERLVNFPFRAYEFVYNSFYRDERNNPYKIDGQVEYNKYLPSTEGGEDTYHYKLRNANWEQDFLTTATASPQFGVAPLVGVTATGTMTFADDEGNTYTAKANVGDDGDTITGISVHSPDMPVGTLRALIDTVSSGISISDFRNVNALQRLLEKRMRHGLKYVDMIQASFGTRPKNLEISMPEFIGGISRDVIVNAVSQTVDTPEVPLGTKGGQAGVIGGSNHEVSCYADDFGCVIGIMYVAPVPNYSQLLPKHYLCSEALDYFHPEFSHIGYQPILNKEVAPLQFFRDDRANGTDNYNSVFGYQRPWYDMVSKTDEVHGNFRNSMRRYLINRVFDTPPALTEDFLLVDSEQVNDVFAVTEDSDKIFGQVYMQIKRKNAVPTIAIPRLES